MHVAAGVPACWDRRPEFGDREPADGMPAFELLPELKPLASPSNYVRKSHGVQRRFPEKQSVAIWGFTNIFLRS